VGLPADAGLDRGQGHSLARVAERFFADDHCLDALLRRSIAEPGRVDLASFSELRAGLLRLALTGWLP
jgi:hypothetical protein